MTQITNNVLVTPALDKRAELAVDIAIAESMGELVTVLATAPLAISVPNLRILEVLVEYADLFNVELAVFTGIPGADYDPHFDQVTWSLPKVGYDTVVIEAAAIDRMEKLKEEERPRMAGGRPVPTTTEEVRAVKAPSGRSFGVFTPDGSGNDNGDDE